MARRTDPVDPLVQEVLNRTKAGKDAHRTRRKVYDQAYEVYRATQRPKNESWQSKLRVKHAMSSIDTGTINISQDSPRCKVRPRTPMHITGAKALQLAFDYYVAQDHVAQKVFDLAQSGSIYGVAIAKTHWLYQTGQRPTKVQTVDGVQVILQDTVLRDGPSIEPWDPNDAYWEPNARSVDTAEWFALRSYLSKDQLLASACTTKGDHDPLDCNGLYHNVEDLIATGPATGRDRSAQESANNDATQRRKDRYEVVEYWWGTTLIVVGNDQILLRNAPNPHWHGQKPIVAAACRPDLFQLQGIPETELINDLQDALWTLLNMRFDNLHLTVMRGVTYREGGVTDPNALVLKPRFKWPVQDHDDIKAFEIPPLPPEAYEEEQALLSLVRDTTGITPYISGAAGGQIDQNTATGISILNSAATALLRFKARQLQVGIWQRAFEQWGDDIQHFMSEPLWVRLTDDPKTVADFVHIDPQDVIGEYDYILEGSDEALSKQQERQEALALLNAFAPLALTGIINFRPLLEKIASAFNMTNVDDLFQQPPQQPPAAPHGQQQPFAVFGQQGGQSPLPAGNGSGQTLVGGSAMPTGVQTRIGQQ